MKTETAQQEAVEPIALLANLWWLEYQDAVEDARNALMDGDKLKAIALAIQAHKIKGEYEYYANRLIFS